MNQEIDNEEYISIRRQCPLVWRVDFPAGEGMETEHVMAPIHKHAENGTFACTTP